MAVGWARDGAVQEQIDADAAGYNRRGSKDSQLK